MSGSTLIVNLSSGWLILVLLQEYRKSREKLAKTKERKAKKIAASGWKKSNDIEGHKGLMEMDELLNYVGEKNSNPENTNTQQQKKKLRKKLSASSKQKAVCAGAAVSDVPTVPSVPVFNGGWTSQNSLSFSGDSDIEDRANQQRRPSNSATKHGAAAVRNGDKTSYIITGPPQPRNHFQTIDNDLEGEFKEVHRKKKINHKQTTGLHDKTRSSNAFNPRTTPDSQKTVSHRNTSASVTKGVDSSSASGYNPKVPPCPSPELVNVDFSLNAFPALESQCMDRFAAEEGKVAKAFNHSGLCNDSKDNFMQPTHTSSWAKIAAKPITSKPAPIEKAGHVDLTARNSTITDVPPSTVTSSNVVSSTEIVSNPDTTSTTAPPSRQRNNSHPAAVEDAMTRSASSVSIEFGTVTCSSDVKADRQVCDILSQSFTEGQNIFKCNQSRSTSRSSKNSSAMLDHTARQARVGKAKGVEFLDHHPGLKNKTFNISFGFDEEDKTIAQTNSAMTMSSSCYKPASKNPKTKAAVPCIAPPPSPAQSKDTSPILDQTMHQTSANDNTMCSESGAVEGADSESHKPFTPTTLSSGVDILPLIMCPNSKPIPSNPAAYKSDGFNVVATVRMLQKCKLPNLLISPLLIDCHLILMMTPLIICVLLC